MTKRIQATVEDETYSKYIKIGALYMAEGDNYITPKALITKIINDVYDLKMKNKSG